MSDAVHTELLLIHKRLDGIETHVVKITDRFVQHDKLVEYARELAQDERPLLTQPPQHDDENEMGCGCCEAMTRCVRWIRLQL
jgi:hypothetical protein